MLAQQAVPPCACSFNHLDSVPQAHLLTLVHWGIITFFLNGTTFLTRSNFGEISAYFFSCSVIKCANKGNLMKGLFICLFFGLTVPVYSPSKQRSHGNRGWKQLVTSCPKPRGRESCTNTCCCLSHSLHAHTPESQSGNGPTGGRVFPSQLMHPK